MTDKMTEITEIISNGDVVTISRVVDTVYGHLVMAEVHLVVADKGPIYFNACGTGESLDAAMRMASRSLGNILQAVSTTIIFLCDPLSDEYQRHTEIHQLSLVLQSEVFDEYAPSIPKGVSITPPTP